MSFVAYSGWIQAVVCIGSTLFVGLCFQLADKKSFAFANLFFIIIWVLAVLNALQVAMAIKERLGYDLNVIGAVTLIVMCVVQYRLRFFWHRVLA